MPRIISEKELRDAIKNQTFIKGGKEDNAEGIKYDFCLGYKILKAGNKRPVNFEMISEKDKAEMVVEPGEVVFGLTEEILELPSNIMATLSPKRKMGLEHGILIIGGFCIDPLYHGRLLVGLYNLSSGSFNLQPGKKVVAALFYELRGDEIGELCKPEAAIMDFPEHLIQLMQQYTAISPKILKQEIQSLSEQIEIVRRDFKDKELWFSRFQASLDDLTRANRESRDNIDKVYQSLSLEKESREKGDDKISHDMKALIEKMDKVYMKALVTAATVGGIVGGLSFLFSYLSKFIK